MKETEMAEDPKVITFGGKTMTADEQEAYRKRIENSRKGINALKGTTPVGHVEKPPMPNFQELQARRAAGIDDTETPGPGRSTSSGPRMSEETKQMLEDATKVAKEIEKETAEKKTSEKEDDDDIFDLLAGASSKMSEAEKILNNKARRKAIESRCSAMKFEDLLMKNEVQQTVPILAGEFEPRFRSMTPDENLFIKRFIAKEPNVSEQYILEKYTILQLTCALVSINGKMLPDHRDKDGYPDEKAFIEKLKIVTRKSGYIVADLSLNYYWFDLRVRRLINPDALGNG
jgi:hypothetical protein